MTTTRPTAAEAGEWVADLLPDFEQRTIPLPDVVPARGEAGGFCCTLVRPTATVAPQEIPSPACAEHSVTAAVPTERSVAGAKPEPHAKTAIVYLPGFNDYFFHTHVADFFTARGFGFYAVDPRRCGRSWREGQYRSYADHIDDYAVELDLACAQVAADGYTQVVLYGHSTGGLVASLYADRPGVPVGGVILNSPFLALPGPAGAKRLLPAVRRIAARTPERFMPGTDNGLYARSLHVTLGGEWEYDLAHKPNPTEQIRYGWLAAVAEAQALVLRGLNIPAPVLCLTSARSSLRRTWDEDCTRVDIVLDQKRCGAAATRLGRDVTVVRIPDGVHDLALSRPEARGWFFAAMERWLPYAGL